MANTITRWAGEDAPNLLLAIDPGASFPGNKTKEQIPYAGCALFQHGLLVWAGLVKCPLRVQVEGGKYRAVSSFSRPNMLVRAICKATNVARHGGVVTGGRAGRGTGGSAGSGGKPERDAGGKQCGRCGRGGGVGQAGLGEALSVLAVENPLLYRHGAARPADIIALKGIYGAIMGGIDAEFYSGPNPAEWKGTVDKSIMNERTINVLNKAEHLLLVNGQAAGSSALGDHALDAVGLGCWVLGRIGTGGVV